MSERERVPGGWRSRFKCRERDVLQAFHALSEAVRGSLKRAEIEPLTLHEAARIADHLREQRELVRQILARKEYSRAKHLLSLNQRARDRFLDLAERAHLAADALRSRCEHRSGSSFL